MKKLLLIIVILIGLVIAAALVAPYFISADTVKQALLQRIEAATGRHVTVDGRFQLRFFPVAGVTMDNVTIANPPSYGDTSPLMTLKSLDVDVAVVPLLSRTIEIKKLVLEAPQVNLHVTKDGRKNWLPPQQAQAAAGASSSSPSASVMALPQNLTLNDVKMTDGSIVYDDEAAKQQGALRKLNASLSLNGVSSPFKIDADGEWNGKKITLKGTLATLQTFLNGERTKINAAIAGELLAVNLDGDMENSVYTGKAAVKSPSLKALMAWVDPAAKPIDSPAPLALNVSGDVECSAQNCTLSNAGMALDNLQARGGIKVNHGGGHPPRIDADLTAGVLDFNPFFSSPAAAISGLPLLSEAYAETSGRWSDKPFDLSALQSFNGSVNIVADGMVIKKVTLGKTTLRAKLENGKVNGAVVDAVLYGGKDNSTFAIDAATSAFEEQDSLKGVQLQPLLKDTAGLSRLSGTADVDIAATGHGRSEKEIVESLAGNGQFAVANGSIEGVDLTGIILRKAGAAAGSGATPISDMKGTFTIAQGVVSNKDLVMAVPGLHVDGQGDVNLPAYTINYRLTPQVEAAKSGAARTGVAVPVVIEGSLEKPAIHPDLNAVAQEAIKNPKEFRQQLQNTRKDLENNFKGGLKNPNAAKSLKNLLNGL